MNVLITGAAGNVGSFLARRLLYTTHSMKLMYHRKLLPHELITQQGVTAVHCDLARPESLKPACEGVDCIVHFAGVLFRPNPEKFLPITNTQYLQNIVNVAISEGVKKFILISFPHVEGHSTPINRAPGRPDPIPDAVHSKTRLAAEQYLRKSCSSANMRAVVLRAGILYGRRLKFFEAAWKMMHLGVLFLWEEPTWIHLLSLPDFLEIVLAAIEGESVEGIYNIADDEPVTYQTFLDELADYWNVPRPMRLPAFWFPIAAGFCERLAALFGTGTPLTRDLMKMGMTSVVADTSRMKKELYPKLIYPNFRSGLSLL